MFSIDTTSNKDYYIILKDGKEFTKVSKRNNLETVMNYFQIKEVRKCVTN